jgi:hypothetical protein
MKVISKVCSRTYLIFIYRSNILQLSGFLISLTSVVDQVQALEMSHGSDIDIYSDPGFLFSPEDCLLRNQLADPENSMVHKIPD